MGNSWRGVFDVERGMKFPVAAWLSPEAESVVDTSDCATPVAWIHKIIPFRRGSHSKVGERRFREGREVGTVVVLLMYVMVVGTSC